MRLRGLCVDNNETVQTSARREEPQLGEARCPGISWDDLVAADPRGTPEFLQGEQYQYLGSEPIPAERYTSPDFARLERERMWPYVWQFAAREEELLAPGQSVLSEHADRSYFLHRYQDGSEFGKGAA